MGDTFEERVYDVDQSKHAEDGKERAMVGVKVFLVIDELIERAFGRKKEKRCEKENRGRDEHEEEQEKRPGLLVAPAIEDPPRDHEIEKQIHNPNRVHPVDA